MPHVFTFAHDFLGEGIPAVLDRLEEAGLDGVTVAFAYHASRDVFPHNPLGVMHYLESGATYFPPETGRYGESALQPVEAGLTRGSTVLEDLAAATSARDMRLGAWAVMLHNSRLAQANPDDATLTALGDRLFHALCPANPRVRAYAQALAGDIASRGVAEVRFESLSYMGWDHGHHHERNLIELGPATRFLMGLCFCPHCCSAASSDGVGVDALREAVSKRLRASLQSAASEPTDAPVDREELAAFADGQLDGYLRVRERVVTELVRDVVAAVAAVDPGIRSIFLDASGAELGYATGRPTTDAPATSIAWRHGVNLGELSRTCDLAVAAYFADPDRARREIASYGEVLDPQAGAQVDVVLRPGWPDTIDAASLAAKVDAARAPFVRDIGFYHYGLMRLESLDWIAVALRAG